MAASGGPYTDGRRGGRPWVAWLIILIIIAFIVWLIVAYAAGGPGNRAAGTGNQPAAGNYPQTAPITDLAAIVGAQNRQALAGRTVSLSNVTVGDVADGRGFWVDRGGQQLFVQTPNQQNVTRGQNISVSGTLERAPDNPQQTWNVDPATARMISQEGVYLIAGNIGGAS